MRNTKSYQEVSIPAEVIDSLTIRWNLLTMQFDHRNFAQGLDLTRYHRTSKRRAHLLISANHRMERFSNNDPWVIFNKITSSSMTLENRHSFRICFANERYFHNKSFIGERFSAVYISLTGLIDPYLIPQRALLSPKEAQYFP